MQAVPWLPGTLCKSQPKGLNPQARVCLTAEHSCLQAVPSWVQVVRDRDAVISQCECRLLTAGRQHGLQMPAASCGQVCSSAVSECSPNASPCLIEDSPGHAAPATSCRFDPEPVGLGGALSFVQTISCTCSTVLDQHGGIRKELGPGDVVVVRGSHTGCAGPEFHSEVPCWHCHGSSGNSVVVLEGQHGSGEVALQQ